MTGVVIRKVVDFVEDTLVEGGKPAARFCEVPAATL